MPSASIAIYRSWAVCENRRRIPSTMDGAMPAFAGTPTICKRKNFTEPSMRYECSALKNRRRSCARKRCRGAAIAVIAHALVSCGWEVRHIMSPENAAPHILTSFAHVEKGTLTYPKPNDSPSLFQPSWLMPRLSPISCPFFIWHSWSCPVWWVIRAEMAMACMGTLAGGFLGCDRGIHRLDLSSYST